MVCIRIKRYFIAAWTAASLLFAPFSHAQDLVSAYLFAIPYESVNSGGDLTRIHPSRFELPSLQRATGQWNAELRGVYSDIYRTQGLEQRGASYSRTSGITLTHDRLVHGVQIRAQFSVSDYRSHVDVPFGDREPAGEVLIGKTRAATSLTAKLGYATGFGSLGWTSDGCPEPGIGIQIEPVDPLSLAVLWERHVVRLDALGYEQGAVADGVIDAADESFTFWGRVQPGPAVEVEARYTRHLMIAGQKSGLTPTLLPWGVLETPEMFMSVDLPDRIRLSLGVRWFSMDLKAYGDRGDLHFSKITSAELDGTGYFGQLRVPGSRADDFILLELEQASLTARSRGHVEFWPWTPVWIDLLGLRRYFRAEFDADLIRTHIGMRKRVSEQFAWDVSLHGMRVWPNGEFEHWRPEFFVFGKEDVRFTRDRVVYFTFAMITLGVEYTRGPWTVMYNLAQGVPFAVRYDDNTTGNGIGGGDDDESLPPGYGGATHRLTVGYSW